MTSIAKRVLGVPALTSRQVYASWIERKPTPSYHWVKRGIDFSDQELLGAMVRLRVRWQREVRRAECGATHRNLATRTFTQSRRTQRRSNV